MKKDILLNNESLNDFYLSWLKEFGLVENYAHNWRNASITKGNISVFIDIVINNAGKNGDIDNLESFANACEELFKQFEHARRDSVLEKLRDLSKLMK